jgi:hypothetical protein
MPTIINGTDDTAATPALTGADTDTGVFFPAANTMAFSTGGTEKMRIDSSGNVGIGTRSPVDKLDVSGGAIRLGDDSVLVWGASGYNNYISGNLSTNSVKILTNGTERMRIDSSGNLLFNSGYGSAATAYGCRAWVNFDGTANTNLTGTYSQTGTTVTVTITAHGYITGSSAYLDFTSGTAVDGAYTVTVTDANTFTVTQASRTTSGNVTSVRSTIRGSGNVSSVSDNGTGDYTVNFTTAMPDANYACVISGGTGAATTRAIASNANLVVPTTTASRIGTSTGANVIADYAYISVSYFR